MSFIAIIVRNWESRKNWRTRNIPIPKSFPYFSLGFGVKHVTSPWVLFSGLLIPQNKGEDLKKKKKKVSILLKSENGLFPVDASNKRQPWNVSTWLFVWTMECCHQTKAIFFAFSHPHLEEKPLRASPWQIRKWKGNTKVENESKNERNFHCACSLITDGRGTQNSGCSMAISQEEGTTVSSTGQKKRSSS